MKTYTPDFVLKFTGYAIEQSMNNMPYDLHKAIVKFEDIYNRKLPANFHIEDLIVEICDFFKIQTDEFMSDFQYGELPQARQLLCYILAQYNVKSGEISRMTGYKQSRVINSIKNVRTKFESGEFPKLERFVKRYLK